MKTIYQLQADYKISITKLRRMVSNGDLQVVSGEQNDIEKSGEVLKRGQSLSVRQIITFIREPEKLETLGAYKHAAKTQIRLLGDIQSQALSIERPHNLIVEAGMKDKTAVDKFGDWMASIIPENGCSYHYVAVRALFNVEDRFQEVAQSYIARAVLQGRTSASMQGMSGLDDKGKTIFFRREKVFDL